MKKITIKVHTHPMTTINLRKFSHFIVFIVYFLSSTGYAPDAIASCNVSDTTATCSGDLDSVSYTDGTVTTIQLQNLDQDITGDIAVELSDNGKTGSSDSHSGTTGEDLTIQTSTEKNFTGTDIGIVINSTGGKGHSGNDNNAVAGNEHGGDGGSGGDGGAVTFDIERTEPTVSGGSTAISATSNGGEGNEGGEGSSEAGTGFGGKGGTGGAGAAIDVTLSGSVSVSDGENGIVLQSIGANGGKGGEGGGEVGKGGEGGTGGTGGNINLSADTTASTIVTDHAAGYGIEVSSLAGNGGKGGEGAGISGEGGKGGSGGTGGSSTASTSASISTKQDESVGILIRSYGGNGGDGGSADGIVASGGADNAPGPAGAVVLTFTGDISTAGSQSIGILAQSIGGFAGEAGDSVAELVAFGANDQSGGNAGDITVTLGEASDVSIKTTNDYASGVEMHSVGGGGGVGSISVAEFSQLGSEGSAGGDGGNIDFTIDFGEQGSTEIVTTGDRAMGVAGVSSGGGGGSSGTALGIASVGGSAGSGGDGGKVTAYLGALNISTKGQQADAVYFASIGGGGGNAGSTDGIIAIGGSGGSGGTGGTVSVTGLEGAITSEGDDADAVLIQSIGGGGGKGSSALAVGAEVSIAHGGTGGDGGNAGKVTYTDSNNSTESVATSGDRARGVVVQSIGGGGGSAGYATSISAGVIFDTSIGITSGGGNGSDAGQVTVKNHSSISTAGESATGLLAQSIGGGGGSVGNTVAVDAAISSALDVGIAIGGSGGDGGDGKQMTVDVFGDITTTGNEATALQVQSIGGGGGNSSSTWAASGAAGDGANLSVNLAIDGSGGGGGTGGDITINSSGTIATSSANSDGMLLQSIGGGGGNAGMVGIIDVAISSYDISLAIGGNGGSGGDGGEVNLTSSSSITTQGDASSGIKTQSIGGSGGDGSNVMALDALDSGTLDITIGGAGGNAQDAEDINITSTGDISTQGELAEGIVAQSIGGSGGSAGYMVDASAIENTSFDIEVSGNTGAGGSSGSVTVNNSGHIITKGSSAPGLWAQSVAGGGGSAGVVISGDALTTSALSVEVGGNGGYGGSAGKATVVNQGTINTQGDYAYGINSQSIAGSGGVAAQLIAADISAVKGTSNFTVVGVGGSGGGGGVAAAVDVENGASISTGGYAAHGILAQSIGGAGGAGGSVTAASIELTTKASSSTEVVVGGSGGDGGSAGDVKISNTAKVSTTGDLADALFAQSIGSGGGVGGGSFSYIFSGSSTSLGASATGAISVDVGGEGGTGSKGGDVTVSNSSTLNTSGGNANAITAMSVGGFGGDGGSASNFLTTFAVSSNGTMNVSATVDVGGSGGSGNLGGSVNVENKGDINTTNDISSAIYASSVGGGGGSGGSASAITFGTTVAIEGNSTYNGSVSVSVGGTGGTGGNADTVTVSNSAAIQTAGATSYGIFAQSVGGGGGTGGNGKFGINGWGSTANNIAQYISDANELFNDYQKLSNLYTNVAVKIGGSGGAAGHGGEIQIDNSEQITTQGDSATAIYAQSIGGGGGVGGDGGGGLITSIDIAGQGSGGGKGGEIDISNSNTITTQGSGAMGIYAQSLGGGGGSAGDVEGSLAADLIDLTIGLASVAGADVSGDGGNGGAITIDKTGNISTSGDYAHAVWAHSVGGGGGAAAIIGFTGITYGGVGSSSDSGNGDNVSITVDGDISVSGDYAHGVFAQSASGSGESDTAGTVNIDVTGNISASGADSRAILAQSDGNSSNGAIIIDVAEGSTIQGSDTGYETIGLLNGADNVLTNAGNILGPVDSNSVAVIHSEVYNNDSGGNLSITNSGTITGSINLKAHSSNELNNASDGTLNMGPLIYLGSKGTLNNDGVLSPGGAGSISSSTITGELSQSSTGSYLADVKLSATASSDQLMLDSANASFAGTLEPNVLSYDTSSGSNGSVTVISSTNGNIDASKLTVSSSETVSYSLSGDASDTITLNYSIDASGASSDSLSSENTTSVGAFLNEAIVLAVETPESYPSLGDVLTPVLKAANPEQLEQMYIELAAEEAVLGHYALRAANLGFNSVLPACPSNSKNGLVDFNHEGECFWLRVDGGTFKQDQAVNRVSYRLDAWNITLGGQLPAGSGFGDQLFIGFAGTYQGNQSENDNYSSDGDIWQVGAFVKQEIGATTLSASLAGGYFGNDIKRTISQFNETGAVASGRAKGGLLSGDIRAYHDFAINKNFYVKPILALTVVQIWQEDYTESGAGQSNLSIDSVEQTSLVLSPQLEFGYETDSIRGFIRAGASYYTLGSSTDVSMRFADQSTDTPALTLTDEIDNIYGNITLGLDTQVTDNVTVSITGNTTFSENTLGFGGSGSLRIEF